MGHEMTDEIKPKKKILIADDDPVSIHLLKNFLDKWGYDVTVATDGTQALQMLESDNTPRLVVLDWMMPGLEGVQICQQIRERVDKPYVYILLLTARSQKKDLLQGLEFGADDYLTKPFDSQELRARLHIGERILNLEDELRFRATHDTLTGISSRGVALEAVSREQARQARDKSSFGIILADLDHFKNINDTYGHICGDAVLKEAAQRMIGCARRYDTVGRYGGEEFLIVVPSAEESITLAVAERTRVAIESQRFATDFGELHVTASFGVAASTRAIPVGAGELLRLADEALYRAKRQGRNRSEGTVSLEPKDPDCENFIATPIPVKSYLRSL
jgi:two-component system cell cycle response regulator